MRFASANIDALRQQRQIFDFFFPSPKKQRVIGSKKRRPSTRFGQWNTRSWRRRFGANPGCANLWHFRGFFDPFFFFFANTRLWTKSKLTEKALAGGWGVLFCQPGIFIFRATELLIFELTIFDSSRACVMILLRLLLRASVFEYVCITLLVKASMKTSFVLPNNFRS